MYYTIIIHYPFLLFLIAIHLSSFVLLEMYRADRHIKDEFSPYESLVPNQPNERLYYYQPEDGSPFDFVITCLKKELVPKESLSSDISFTKHIRNQFSNLAMNNISFEIAEKTIKKKIIEIHERTFFVCIQFLPETIFFEYGEILPISIIGDKQFKPDQSAYWPGEYHYLKGSDITESLADINFLQASARTVHIDFDDEFSFKERVVILSKNRDIFENSTIKIRISIRPNTIINLSREAKPGAIIFQESTDRIQDFTIVVENSTIQYSIFEVVPRKYKAIFIQRK